MDGEVGARMNGEVEAMMDGVGEVGRRMDRKMQGWMELER